MGVRNLLISMFSFICILGPGAVLFRHSEAGSMAITVAAFVVGFTVLHVLDGRQLRREQGRDRTTSA